MTETSRTAPMASNWYPALIFIIAFLFFSRSFPSYFVCDDFQFLDRVNFSNAGAYLTQSWGYGNEYRPFLPYTYALDALISGANPIGYHITNTLLHLMSGLLIARIAVMIGMSVEAAALANIIFLVNPVSHEAVLWIAGRPVVLVACLMLACCHLFLTTLRRTRPSFWHWAGVYALFLLALATYELAIVTPLLAGFLAYFSQDIRRPYKTHLAVLVGISGLYGAFWNWFFSYRFTRIQIEHSYWQILKNFGDALAHAFHGSLGPAMAVVYLVLLVLLWRGRKGRMLTVAALVWFAIAYLPYFAVKGFADRFAYLSSAAAAVVLAACLLDGIGGLRNSWQKRIAVLGLVAYLATGMQNRITSWKEAGEIARVIPLDIKREMPVYPQDRQVVLLNVPLMHKRSYVYLTSLDRAISREYPGERVHFKTSVDSSVDDSAIILEYSAGHMVRRSLADVR